MKNLLLLTVFTFALGAASQVQAQTIADWNFDSTADSSTITSVTPSATSASISADIGSGTAKGIHASSSSAWSSPAGNGAGGSFSVNNWGVGDSFQFEVSTLNFNNIQISWDQTGSATGPANFTLAYSTNGTSFTTLETYSVLVNGSPNSPWSGSVGALRNSAYTLSYDLSSTAAASNDGTLYFELIDNSTTSLNGGTVGTGGTGRVDNFLVTGTAIAAPEPSAWALMAAGLGLLAFVRSRRAAFWNR